MHISYKYMKRLTGVASRSSKYSSQFKKRNNELKPIERLKLNIAVIRALSGEDPYTGKQLTEQELIDAADITIAMYKHVPKAINSLVLDIYYPEQNYLPPYGWRAFVKPTYKRVRKFYDGYFGGEGLLKEFGYI